MVAEVAGGQAGVVRGGGERCFGWRPCHPSGGLGQVLSAPHGQFKQPGEVDSTRRRWPCTTCRLRWSLLGPSRSGSGPGCRPASTATRPRRRRRSAGHLGGLVASQVVHHHDVPRPQASGPGTRRRRPRSTPCPSPRRRPGRPPPGRRRAGPRRSASSTFQWPCGTGPSTRTPLAGAAVGAVHRRGWRPLSSTKTSRAGSIAANSSRQAARSAFNSGRSCSAARRDFFSA